MKFFKNVYINGTGSFLPNKPVSNDEIADFIQPVTKTSSRLQRRILAENGIKTRYYGINKEGQTTHSLAQMCAASVEAALTNANVKLDDIDLLCTGTTGGDVAIPGFANMLQGHLKAPPMETSSHTGICMSGVVALKHAAYAVETGDATKALVSAGEFPSRMFKKSRFQTADYNIDFDAHFLRWMLSDGAGSWVVSDAPSSNELSLKVNFIHTKSFSGDFPVCMYIGAPKGEEDKSYLDYPSLKEAEEAGAFYLRQNIKLLPNIFEVGAHEYIKLVKDGHIKSEEVEHFLCHYSSEKFKPIVKEVIDKSEAVIDSEKWFSNLSYQGNMGSASIFVMLNDFIEKKREHLNPGDKILCMVPESGRFSISFMMLEVVKNDKNVEESTLSLPASPAESLTPTNHRVRDLLRELTQVWHQYRSEAWRSPFVNKIRDNKLNTKDYLQWMENWIPQVREGSKWMRNAVSHLEEPYTLLKSIIEEHASDEQDDWKILHKDYLNSGGLKTDPDLLERNMGGEALNAFMYQRASRRNAIDLLGGIFIIEGTGQKIIPMLLPLMKKSTALPPNCFKFLHYHGVNDEDHLLRWLSAVELACDNATDEEVTSIVKTAKAVSELYLMQLREI